MKVPLGFYLISCISSPCKRKSCLAIPAELDDPVEKNGYQAVEEELGDEEQKSKAATRAT